jgi:acyl carrier protein
MAQVREYLEREFLYMRPGFELGDDDALLATGVIDSMGVLEVIVFLENTLHVTVADNQITAANLGTIRAIAQFVAIARQGSG